MAKDLNAAIFENCRRALRKLASRRRQLMIDIGSIEQDIEHELSILGDVPATTWDTNSWSAVRFNAVPFFMDAGLDAIQKLEDSCLSVENLLLETDIPSDSTLCNLTYSDYVYLPDAGTVSSVCVNYSRPLLEFYQRLPETFNLITVVDRAAAIRWLQINRFEIYHDLVTKDISACLKD